MIKKIIIFLFLFVSFIEVYSQGNFIYKIPFGNNRTLVYSKGLQGADTAFVFIGSYTDTTTANYGSTDAVPGAVIRTSDNKLWLRNNTHTTWVEIGGGGGSNVDSLFGVQDNVFTADRSVNAKGYRFEVDSASNLYFFDYNGSFTISNNSAFSGTYHYINADQFSTSINSYTTGSDAVFFTGVNSGQAYGDFNAAKGSQVTRYQLWGDSTHLTYHSGSTLYYLLNTFKRKVTINADSLFLSNARTGTGTKALRIDGATGQIYIVDTTTGGGSGKVYSTITIGAFDAKDVTSTHYDYFCDGTDDDVQILAAIAALPSEGGRILLSEGTFNIGAAIVINKSNVILEGNGDATKINLENAKNVDVIVLGDGIGSDTAIRIRNLFIDGNMANQSTASRGIRVRIDAGRAIIEYCTIQNTRNSNILDDGAEKTLIQYNYCNTTKVGVGASNIEGIGANAIITGNTCLYGDYAGIYAYQGSGVLISGNRVENGKVAYIESDFTKTSIDNNYCIVANVPTSAVIIASGGYQSITNNKIHVAAVASAVKGIYATDWGTKINDNEIRFVNTTPAHIGIDGTSGDYIINNNFILNAAEAAANSGSIGIRVATATINNGLTGNYVNGFDNGIIGDGTNNTNIVSNLFYNCDTGISVTGCTNSLVVANKTDGVTNPIIGAATDIDISHNRTNAAAERHAPLTTKGDLMVGNATGLAARLGVGTDGFVLTADAASTNGIKWAAGGGGGTPAGSNTEIQYNNSGAFGASPAFTVDNTSKFLKVTGTGATAASIQIENANVASLAAVDFIYSANTGRLAMLANYDLYWSPPGYGGSALFTARQSDFSMLFSGYTQHELQLKVKEIAAPSTPASGYAALYTGTDNRFYIKDDAGLVTRMDNQFASLTVNTTTVGNVGVGEDDLMTYSVPAAKLASDGDYIDFEMSFSFAANTNAKQVKVYFGGTQIFASGSQIQNGGNMLVKGKVIRTSATTQRITFSEGSNTTLFTDVTVYTTAAETLSGAITLKATGEATNNDDITQTVNIVNYIRSN